MSARRQISISRKPDFVGADADGAIGLGDRGRCWHSADPRVRPARSICDVCGHTLPILGQIHAIARWHGVRLRSRVAAPSTTYEPRRPAQGALYQIVRDHFETFRAQAASLRDGEGLPRFVEQEFRDFLQCGWLAGGFARFRCGDCGLDRLVPFSCKGRALCPSCGGRRMAERAAHLLDHVFPDVPVRQWVLSLPYRLRYQLAWNHDVCRGVVAVFVRAVLGFLRARARDGGVADGRGGAVAVIQRFGGASI